MSFEIIRADYEQLGDTAVVFRHHAHETRDLLHRIRRALEELRGGGWVGQGAAAFYAEMDEEILPAIEKLILSLDEADLTTRQIARIFQIAEEEAAASVRDGTR
jgi:WXG100 family type VII secretion target